MRLRRRNGISAITTRIPHFLRKSIFLERLRDTALRTTSLTPRCNLAHPHPADEIVDRAGRDALDVNFLHDSRERLFAHAPRFQELRGVAALAQLWDPQLDRADPGFPGPTPVAAALDRPVGLGLDVELHQALSRKAQHLAYDVGVGLLGEQGLKGDHIFGQRGALGFKVARGSKTLPEKRGDHRSRG